MLGQLPNRERGCEKRKKDDLTLGSNDDDEDGRDDRRDEGRETRCERGGWGVQLYSKRTTGEKRKQPISNKTKDGINEVQNPHNSYGERDEERKENQRQNERKQMNRNKCHNRESRLNRNEKVSGKLVPSFDANSMKIKRQKVDRFVFLCDKSKKT